MSGTRTTPVEHPYDRFLGALVIESAYRRGASRQELIDLCVKHGRLDAVKLIQEQPRA